MDICDTNTQSWFGWYYHPDLIPRLKRTFAHRVAGRIHSQSFNNKTKEYILLFESDPSAGCTQIYVDLS